MTNKIQEVSTRYLILIIYALLLTPNIKYSNFPAVRVEEVLIVSYFFQISYISYKYNEKILIPKKTMFFIAIIFSLLISILNAFINGYSDSLKEMMVFISWIKYFFIFLISFNANTSFYRINEAFKYATIFLFILVASQYYNIFGLNNYYIQFVAPTQYETLINNYVNPRAVGMIGNPNALAYIFLTSSLLSFYAILNEKLTINNIIWFICSIIGIIFTQSRTAMIAIICGLLVLAAGNLILRKSGFLSAVKQISLWTFLVSLILFIFFNQSIYEKYLWRFNTILDYQQTDSWRMRLTNWSENLSYFKAHYFFGVGPLKSGNLIYPADNEWLLLARTYGIIGIIILMLFVSTFLKFNNKKFILVLSVLIATFIYMVAAAVFNSLVLMPLLIIILQQYGIKQNEENNNENLSHH